MNHQNFWNWSESDQHQDPEKKSCSESASEADFFLSLEKSWAQPSLPPHLASALLFQDSDFWTKLFQIPSPDLTTQWIDYIQQSSYTADPRFSYWLEVKICQGISSGFFLDNRAPVFQALFETFNLNPNRLNEYQQNYFFHLFTDSSFFDFLTPLDPLEIRRLPLCNYFLSVGVNPSQRDFLGRSPLSMLNDLIHQDSLQIRDSIEEEDLLSCAQMLINATQGNPQEFIKIPPLESVIRHPKLRQILDSEIEYQSLLSMNISIPQQTSPKRL